MSDFPKIPLCQSEFLQDFTIKFGVYVKDKDPGWRYHFQAEVEQVEHEDETLERLTFWIKTYDYTRTNLILWEDKTVWISIQLLAADHHTTEFEVGFYPDFTVLTFDEMLEAIDNTISISTRLCYRDSPVKTLQLIWKHKGEVKTIGTLA